MTSDLVRRTEHVLRPDPARVITTELIPSAEGPPTAPTRMGALLHRVLSLSDEQVAGTLARAIKSFGPRHADLTSVLETRFTHVSHNVADSAGLSSQRRQLIGAYMSQEYALEGAALFNPSMVPHFDQSGLEEGTTRFIMSVRGVGEGHISCVQFRTGTIDASDELRFDRPGAQTTRPVRLVTQHSRTALERLNDQAPGPSDGAAAVLGSLPSAFSTPDLEAAVARWSTHSSAVDAAVTGARLNAMSQLAYAIEFPADTRLDSRVIMPGSPAESHGLEDVRLVRVASGYGPASYLGTYTAFDGVNVAPHLLTTDDFTSFDLRPLSGTAAKNKGMAVFPRMIGGEYLGLSRWDRENNSLATSADLVHWEDAGTLHDHRQTWEIVQSGNCGSPLETDIGWLVLTHGVGPMREYSIGAMLLDLDDPSKVVGYLDEPLLSPNEEERNGYVPNVVYSCGAMLHGDTMVLPYGASDARIHVALVDVPSLLERLRPRRRRAGDAAAPGRTGDASADRGEHPRERRSDH